MRKHKVKRMESTGYSSCDLHAANQNSWEDERDKWVQAAMDVRRKEHREGTLDDFNKLIHEQTMLMNDALFSKEAGHQYTNKKSSKQDNSNKRISTFATNPKSDKENKRNVQTRYHCLLHATKTIFWIHARFLWKRLVERTKLFANKKLCYGGYQPMTSIRNTKTCKQRLLCRICQEYHPAGMQFYVKKVSQGNTESKDDTKDTAKCALVKGKLDTEMISMCMVHVLVGHRNSRKIVKTYAMLDICSQGSFIEDEIIEDLSISGRKLKLSLKTLTGEKAEYTEAVDGLIISAFD